MLIKKTLIAAAAIAASFVAFQPQAEAGTKVGIYIGTGHSPYSYRPYRAYRSYRANRPYRPYRAYRRFRPGPYYTGGYHANRAYRPYAAPAAYTRWPAGRVRRSLRNRGYYRFSGLHYRNGCWIVNAARHGRHFKLVVSGYTGAIVRRHRIY